MPIYEYECLQCGKNLEIIQKFSDAPLSVCPECKGELKKCISNTSFVLKGSGWYVTDYASADRKKGSDSEKSPSETKTESKKENAPESKKDTTTAAA